MKQILIILILFYGIGAQAQRIGEYKLRQTCNEKPVPLTINFLGIEGELNVHNAYNKIHRLFFYGEYATKNEVESFLRSAQKTFKIKLIRNSDQYGNSTGWHNKGKKAEFYVHVYEISSTENRYSLSFEIEDVALSKKIQDSIVEKLLEDNELRF